MNTITAHAILGVRLLALFFGMLGAWLLTANLIESVGDFNPSYSVYFILTQVARPAVAIAGAILLWVFSKPVGRLAGRGLS